MAESLNEMIALFKRLVVDVTVIILEVWNDVFVYYNVDNNIYELMLIMLMMMRNIILG